MMTMFHLWNLPGDVLAAPESASGLDRCNISLSLSLVLEYVVRVGFEEAMWGNMRSFGRQRCAPGGVALPQ